MVKIIITIELFDGISSDFSEHRVTSFRDLMHEDEDDSGEEEGQRYQYHFLILGFISSWNNLIILYHYYNYFVSHMSS